MRNHTLDNYLAAKNELPNLIQAEGRLERFADTIRNLDLGRLAIGASRIYGTYENRFICQDKRVINNEEGSFTVASLIRCLFYENTEEIYLLVLNANGLQADKVICEEIYWFDEDDNHLPLDNDRHIEIFENLDIFFDE